MTTKVLTGYYATGYTVAAGVTVLSITATGRVAGSGLGFTGYVTVANNGVVDNIGSHQSAVNGSAGGAVFNGAASERAALIEGDINGVALAGAPGKVVNFGTIVGEAAFGVELDAGGSITNGSVAATRATIGGYAAGILADGPATVTNFGAIYAAGLGGAYGVAMQAGGALVNGSATSHAAVISGYSGVYLSDVYSPGARDTLTNFGTIEGVGAGDNAVGAPFSGVYVNTGGAIINGAANDPVALIEGYEGVEVHTTAPLSVTNFGVIDGLGGVAVQFKTSSDALIVEAGCRFVGQVLGAGGTLDLASGTGTITGLFAAGGNITVSGSMATTTFQDFGALMVGAGASFSDKRTVTLAAGQSVIDAGTLTLKGAVRNGGTLEAAGGVLTVMGAVSGKGVALVDGGTLHLAGAFTQNVTFTGGAGTLELGQSQGYTGSITGFSTSGGTLLDLTDIAFVGAGEATFSGTASGGVLTVTDGTHTATISLTGDYLGSTFVAASDGHGGVLIHDPGAAAGQARTFAAAMAGLATPGEPAAVASSVRADRPPLLLATPAGAV